MGAVRVGDEGEGQPDADRGVAEAALLLRAQRDLSEFEPLYRRYYRPIFGYCHRRLRDREAAADATSQTFAKALAGIHGYRHGSVAAWLFTIARNVVTDGLRRRRPHLALDEAGFVIDAEPGPDEQAIANDRQRALFAALRHLTPDQRHVVELRLAGLSGPEVAAVLGIGLGAVKSSQFRAYARLRRLLAAEDLPGDPR